MDQVNKQSSKPQPVKMTEAQMDNVAGGALLIDVYVIDVANNNNVAVAIPAHVNVNAVVALLGAAGGGIVSGQRPGNIDQRR